MRTLKSIMVLGLALSTFTATEAAKLTFKVTNPNEKVKVRLTFSQSGEQKEVAIGLKSISGMRGTAKA